MLFLLYVFVDVGSQLIPQDAETEDGDGQTVAAQPCVTAGKLRQCLVAILCEAM